MAQGCDTTVTLIGAQIADLKQAGYRFVARYINGGWKQMYKDEAKRLSDYGLFVVSLYQEFNNEARRFSRDIGRAQAERAVKLARSLSQPPNTPIYFAVDFDATRKELENNIVAFFNGVSDVFENEPYRIGVYGSYMVCGEIRKRFTHVYTMIAAASSGWGGNALEYQFGDWNLRQYEVDKVFKGVSRTVEIDKCESSTLGGGGWRI